MKNILALIAVTFIAGFVQASDASSLEISIQDSAGIKKLMTEKVYASVEADMDVVVFEPACQLQALTIGPVEDQTKVTDVLVCAVSFVTGDRFNGIYKVVFSVNSANRTIDKLIFEATEGSY